jgi:hypothetical protein
MNRDRLYWTENEEKSCIVERWNRTMKQLMWKHFVKHRTSIYLDILSELVTEYDNTCYIKYCYISINSGSIYTCSLFYNRAIKCTLIDARRPNPMRCTVTNRLLNKNRGDLSLKLVIQSEL